jgi:hypothetical protein
MEILGEKRGEVMAAPLLKEILQWIDGVAQIRMATVGPILPLIG